MVQKTTNGLYRSTLLPIFGLTHGFTSKVQHSMQETANRDAFLTSIGVSPQAVVWAKQAHGNTIHTVSESDMGKTIEDVDGFIYKKDATWAAQPLLAVHVGDCVPLLFVDPTKDIIGVAHAGWKGTKDHIARFMIQAFVRLGSNAKNMYVVIGPYNHACCYEVDENRAMLFEREFPGGRGIVNKSKDAWYVDIGMANIADLRGVGVLESHIDCNIRLCTHCNALEFYSYRRTTEPFGEIMGYIGYHEIV